MNGFDYIVGHYFINSECIKIIAGFRNECSAKSYCEMIEFNFISSAYITFIKNPDGSFIFFNQKHHAPNFVNFEKAYYFDASKDTEILLDDKVYKYKFEKSYFDFEEEFIK